MSHADVQQHHHHSGHHSKSRSNAAKRKKRVSRGKRIRQIAPLIGLVFAFSGLLFGIYLMEKAEEESSRPQQAETVVFAKKADVEYRNDLVFFEGNWYAPKENLETTLVLGVDKNSDYEYGVSTGYEQADLLLLMVADNDAHTYSAVHINRDTMTDIDILTDNGAMIRTATAQIALAHTYGARSNIQCKNTVRAVSRLMNGVGIDHYLSLTMDSVGILNDAVGGVKVQILDDFSGIDDTLKQGESVTLLGEHALNYVRARRGMSDPTNLNRIERQKQYLTAFQDAYAAKVRSDSSFALTSLLSVSDGLESDCTLEMLSDIINHLFSYESMGYRTIDGESVAGETFMEYYPDVKALRALVMDIFYHRVDI